MSYRKIDLRRLNLSRVTTEVILANDIYNDAGIMIASIGTRLDRYTKRRILRHGKAVVTIWENDELTEKTMNDGSFLFVDKEKDPDFVEFRKNYEKMDKEVTEVLDAAREGRAVDFDKAYGITSSMIEKIGSNSKVFLYMNYIRDYDINTSCHSNYVAMMSNIFGRWLNLPKDELAELTVGGVLHDVGKITVPLEIINKPGKLSKDEYNIVKNHTVKGLLMLKKLAIPDGAVLCAYSHHERSDGTGYPLGLTGSKIDFCAKAVAIIDIFDAMTSKRSYRAPICPFDVIRTLEVGMYGNLDTELLLIFLRNIAENYVGGWVKLSNGEAAKVVFIHPRNITKPIVQTTDNRFIDLSERMDLKISAVI